MFQNKRIRTGPFIFVHLSRNPQAGGLLFELKIKGGS